jgi:hypothetical protein
VKGGGDCEVEVYSSMLAEVPEWKGAVKRIPRRREFTECEKIFFSFLKACGGEGASPREIVENTGISDTGVREILQRWEGKLVECLGEKRVNRCGWPAKIYRLRKFK